MTKQGPLVLVIDDEPQMRRLLTAGFELQNYRILQAGTVKSGLEAAILHSPDLIILDLALPDGDGAQIVERFRGWSGSGVIVLSVIKDEAEKVRLLELGADDYVTKPFSMAELLARAKVVMRRHARAVSPDAVIGVGSLKVDLANRQVTRNGRAVQLSPKEFRLLNALALNQGKVLTHNQLLKEVWGGAGVEDVQYLRILVRKLRQKIEDDFERPAYIITELGVGYRLRNLEQHSRHDAG